MLKIRIKFRKYGVMRFIGHLDVMRYFQKALRRAELPVAFTDRIYNRIQSAYDHVVCAAAWSWRDE